MVIVTVVSIVVIIIIDVVVIASGLGLRASPTWRPWHMAPGICYIGIYEMYESMDEVMILVMREEKVEELHVEKFKG